MGKLYSLFKLSVFSGKKLFNWVKEVISVFIIIDVIIEESSKIIMLHRAPIKNILTTNNFIENINISFDAKDVT